jgi:hypothetical protein
MRYYTLYKSQAGVAERYTRLSQKQVPQGLWVRISPPAFPLHQRPLTFVPRSISSISFVEMRFFLRKFVGVATSLLHVATPIFSPSDDERGGYASTYRRAALWPVPFNLPRSTNVSRSLCAVLSETPASCR